MKDQKKKKVTWSIREPKYQGKKRDNWIKVLEPEVEKIDSNANPNFKFKNFKKTETNYLDNKCIEKSEAKQAKQSCADNDKKDRDNTSIKTSVKKKVTETEIIPWSNSDTNYLVQKYNIQPLKKLVVIVKGSNTTGANHRGERRKDTHKDIIRDIFVEKFWEKAHRESKIWKKGKAHNSFNKTNFMNYFAPLSEEEDDEEINIEVTSMTTPRQTELNDRPKKKLNSDHHDPMATETELSTVADEDIWYDNDYEDTNKNETYPATQLSETPILNNKAKVQEKNTNNDIDEESDEEDKKPRAVATVHQQKISGKPKLATLRNVLEKDHEIIDLDDLDDMDEDDKYNIVVEKSLRKEFDQVHQQTSRLWLPKEMPRVEIDNEHPIAEEIKYVIPMTIRMNAPRERSRGHFKKHV
jgi:hypothetical protein